MLDIPIVCSFSSHNVNYGDKRFARSSSHAYECCLDMCSNMSVLGDCALEREIYIQFLTALPRLRLGSAYSVISPSFQKDCLEKKGLKTE